MIGTVCWILRCGNNNSMTRLFIFCQLSIAVWLVSQLLILFSESVHQLWISYLIGNIGICCFSPFWLMFSAEYIESPLKKYSGILYFVPAVMFACIATNPLHRLYYTEFQKGSISYGILFYIFQFLFYVLIISGIVFLSRNRKNERSHTMLALATVVPLMINILTISGIIKSKIELTPLFFAFSVIMILIAIRRYGLLDITGIAINDTMDNISTAVIVFNADGNMTYRNRYSDNIIDFGDVCTISDFINKVGSNQGDIEIDGNFWNIRQSTCLNKKGEAIAEVIIINNVSEYYELAEAGKKLSLEHERNRIAQEIHDSAGHTFTMISSLAKILQIETDRDRMLEYTAEIDGLSRSGITQLRCSINNLRDDEFMTSVTGAVQTVITSVRDMDIELCFQGTEDESFAFCIREVYDNIRETLTNAMRYSSADRIDIIVKFLSDRLELYIFDNGRGCREIHENNGLSGIRTRTENIGGEVKFSSSEGDGFATVIKIPKQYITG
ncbi:MAG: two-component sensor histidine kinase [Ruminococcus sp.]|nr:two-component sensor histidine kinase [Ruminococcus sp.]